MPRDIQLQIAAKVLERQHSFAGLASLAAVRPRDWRRGASIMLMPCDPEHANRPRDIWDFMLSEIPEDD